MVRVITAIALSMLALSAQSQTILPYTFTKNSDIKPASLQADFNVSLTAINGLSARVSKLEGNITAADLVGTYAIHGFQTELAPNYVSNYLEQGIATLAADGSLTISGNTEKGWQLRLDTTPRTTLVINNPPEPFASTWSYSDGTVNTPEISLSVVAGGRLLVGVTTNPTDGTQVIILATRTN